MMDTAKTAIQTEENTICNAMNGRKLVEEKRLRTFRSHMDNWYLLWLTQPELEFDSYQSENNRLLLLTS